MNYKYDSAAIARALKMKRGELGWSLDKLSAEIEVGASTLCRVENGLDCSIYTFTKICAWLEMPPGAFFKEQ